MELTQGNILQSLKEVQKFLDEHAEELPGINATGMRKQFDDKVAELTKLAATQTAADLAAKSATRKAGTVTEELIAHHMTHVARIAAVKLPPGPELAPLALPRTALKGERLAASARGMATQAAKFEQTFVDAGLPPDFIKQLEAKADTLSQLLTDRKQNIADRGAATNFLKKEIREARKIVRVLDGFVKTAGRNNPKLLVTWGILKRLRQSVLANPSGPAAGSTSSPTTPSAGAAA